jgi:SSS family solute:Na+ symporter
MNTGINYPALAVLIALFLLVTVMGFWASNWRRGEHLASLDEWGLGGRTFGTWITWFLLGGDLYTAYTFVAVPAAMFAFGSVSGFFAVPYTIILYPIIFIYMSRLWSVSYRHGYVTAAEHMATGSLAEQIGMGTRAREPHFIVRHFIDQQPVRLDMAIPITLPLAFQRVGTIR